MKKTITEDGIRALLSKDIFEVLGLQNLSEEKKKELGEKISGTIEKRVFRRIYKQLADLGKFEEFEVLIKADKDPTEFLDDCGIKTEKIYIEEAILYKSQMKVAADFVDIGLSK